MEFLCQILEEGRRFLSDGGGGGRWYGKWRYWEWKGEDNERMWCGIMELYMIVEREGAYN